MAKYLIKRLLIFLPTLFVITLISFSITVNSPGDPVEALIGVGSELEVDKRFRDAAYIEKRAQMGLDLPLFYFSLGSLAEPDTLHRLPHPLDQQALEELATRYGNWEEISAYHQLLCRSLDVSAAHNPTDAEHEPLALYRSQLLMLRHSADAKLRLEIFESNDTMCVRADSTGRLAAGWQEVKLGWAAVEQNATPWKAYVPVFNFYGANCQYHHWLLRLARLDFGNSFQNGKPVMERIGLALRWTIFISLFVVLVSYAGGIWAGGFSARRRNSTAEKSLAILLFILFSLPSFWVATLLINFLATPDYLKLFPAGGVLSDGATSLPWYGIVLDVAWHLVLPTVCYVYASFTTLSRKMRSSMLEVLESDFIRTARAKGLDERRVVWRHAFRNSLIPMVTSFATVFPSLVGGSVIIENIFGIPGMGREVLGAMTHHDYPVTIAFFTISALLTILGMLAADLGYALVDPRITFSRR